MSLLCTMSADTILTASGPPMPAAALTASSAELTRQARTTGTPASLSSRRAASSGQWPRREPGAGTGTEAGPPAATAGGVRVTSDHQATLRSATMAWRRPGRA